MLRHRIDPIQPLRVYKAILAEIPPLRIPRDVRQLVAKILGVANPMLMETGLPNLARELLSNGKRESAFNALRAPLHGLTGRGRDQKMKMFGHDGEPMQCVAPLVTISENSFQQQLGIRRSNEEGAPLIGRARDCVGVEMRFHFAARKSTPQGLKPRIKNGRSIPGLKPWPTTPDPQACVRPADFKAIDASRLLDGLLL